MSFAFNWQAFAKQEAFQSHIHDMLTNALNKQKPLILEDRIRVVNLDWGTEAPSLEMLEIGDVATDRFRGVFKLSYNGGATITVATKVQANPLNVYANGASAKFALPEFVAAPVSFPIPLHLTLHNIKLQATVIVVFSKQGGLTLVFRNDPLQSIEVNSTFDRFATIASFLQQQIETQIRNLFREEVPSLLYKLSLKYLPSHNQALLGLANQPQRSAAEPVSFALVDSEKAVSLVNILHIGAMLRSRSTLALETPLMPTAIVRSELHHRATLLSQRQSHPLSLTSNDESAYDELYIQARHIKQRSQRKIKRRTIKINRKKEENEEDSAAAMAPKTPEPIPETPATPIEPMPRVRRRRTGLRTFPLHPMVRDAKTPFSIPHILVPPVLPSDFWLHDVQDVDELPPAYVA